MFIIKALVNRAREVSEKIIIDEKDESFTDVIFFDIANPQTIVQLSHMLYEPNTSLAKLPFECQ